MPVAPRDPGVFTHARKAYDDHAVEVQRGSMLLCVACLSWYAHGGYR
ncbi:hypothetical protein ACWDA3_32120 [Nonomuraea rubra]